MSTTQPRSIRSIALVITIAMALSACGRIGTSDPITVTWDAVPANQDAPQEVTGELAVTNPAETGTDRADRDIVFEPAGQPGQNPFSPVMLLTTQPPRPPSQEDPENEGIGSTEDTEVATGLYGGTGTVAVCNVEALVDFLEDESNSDKALAWADALDIEVADIGEYVSSLEVAVLAGPTRVTNNGYSNGHASPFQATLATSTAVLVDESGAPRVRCACGNPLGDPRDPVDVPNPQPDPDPTPTATPTPTPDVPPTQADPDPVDDVEITQPDRDPTDPDNPTDRDPKVNDFCDTWAALAPSILGGPDGNINAYLNQLVAAFTALVAAAEQETDFPDWAMDDFVAYLEDLVYAAETGDLSGGDAALGSRVEGFLSRYCDVPTDDGVESDRGTDLTHVEGS